MKKVIITILLIIVSLLTIQSLFDDDIKNVEYMVDDNIEIYYPKFENSQIDSYINTYLNETIETAKYNFNDNFNMYIDYDYYDNDGIIKLKFYQNVFSNNMEVKKTKIFDIDTKTNTVNISSKDLEYDIYYQKPIDKNKKMIAFTFDDGPNHNTLKIINTLKKYNASATFFVLGSRIEKNEKIIKLMNEYNMEIGNHTYSHKLLTGTSCTEIEKEVKKTNELIHKITNTYPRLVRPSYGSFNNKIRKSVNMPIIIWNIDTLDWKYHNSKRIAKKILSKVEDGDIVLMHDIYSATASAIEIVVPKLIEEGYQIVSVSELFYYKNIELKNGYVYGNAR